jgi:hypothetical protein
MHDNNHVESPENTVGIGAECRYFGSSHSELIRRDLLQQVREQAALFPIVFLIGQGGCGKTILAFQYLLEESTKRLVMMLRSPEVTSDDCIGRELRELRSKDYSQRLPIDPIGGGIDRLRIANEDAEPPYLLIGLDGLDEIAGDMRRGVHAVINQLWERTSGPNPNAILLLTCRTPSRDPEFAIRDLIYTWLQTEYPQMVTDKVGKVFIGDFDEQEIQRAAEKLDADTLDRIRSALSTSEVGGSDYGTLGDPIPRGTARDPRLVNIVRSLQHPALWGLFAKLNPSLRSRILKGESDALGNLAQDFIDRFCSKANRRQPTLTRDPILAALRQVSVAGKPGNSLRDQQTDWVLPMRGPLADPQACLLYNEALTYGLIEEDQAKWRWRHVLVHEYLQIKEIV